MTGLSMHYFEKAHYTKCSLKYIICKTSHTTSKRTFKRDSKYTLRMVYCISFQYFCNSISRFWILSGFFSLHEMQFLSTWMDEVQFQAHYLQDFPHYFKPYVQTRLKVHFEDGILHFLPIFLQLDITLLDTKRIFFFT